MNKGFLTEKYKYDSDRYGLKFRIIDSEVEKSVWEEPPYVGPEAYNSGHIDNILFVDRNTARGVRDGSRNVNMNPHLTSRARLSKEMAKFKP